MKRILLSLTLVGIVTCSLAGFAQTTSPAGDADAASAPTVQDAAPPPAPADPAPAAPAPAPAEAPVAASDAATPAPAADEPAATETAAPAVAQVTPSDAAQPAPAAAATTEGAQPGTVIPLIVMDEVPLTDAIRNLARQAGINYMLDPKIGFGQVGADGKVTAQPNVTIRWENITAEQALNALLNNYTLQLVEDPKSKIARVTIKDPAAPPPLVTKIIQLKYAPPSNVVVSVQGVLTDKRSKIMPDIRTSQLVVVATESEMVDVDKLVTELDQKPRQVLIETKVLETTVNPKTMKGIDWADTLSAQHVTMGNRALDNGVLTSPPRVIADAANNGSFFTPANAFLNADGVSVILSFLNTYAEVRELSTPRSVTLDNEKAVVEVGTMFPIVNVTAGTANTTGGSMVSYSNLTVRLEVTPRISANDFVNLTVNPSITKLGPLVPSQIAGEVSEQYSFLTRNMTTKVMIPSGNTLVMGGLIQDQIQTGNTKVPLLGDIPVLGYLFRHDSKERNNTDLILFITPTIVQDEDYQVTQTDYLKTPVPKKDVLEGEWSAWDSGKPKDWSKKAANPEFQEPTAMEKSKQAATPDFQEPAAMEKSKKVAATPEFQDPEAMVKK